MQRYDWIEKYSVGIEEIDNQHKHFFNIVNEIIKMTGEQDISRDDLLKKIVDLKDYAGYHFVTEEDLFKTCSFPETEDHITAHNFYRKKVDEFMTEKEQDKLDTKKMIIEIAEFTGIWLTNHIMSADQKYATFLRNKEKKQ